MARRPAAKAATLESVAAQVGVLTRRLDALTRAPPSRRRPSVTGDPGIDLAETLATRRGAPYQAGKRRGAVAYAGAAAIDGREYMWQVERPLPGLLALDAVPAAAILAALGHAHRLRLILALLAGPRSAAALQTAIASKSPGPLYHHLRDLLALGVIEQRERTYLIPARHVIPLLTILALTIDLGARPAAT